MTFININLTGTLLLWNRKCINSGDPSRIYLLANIIPFSFPFTLKKNVTKWKAWCVKFLTSVGIAQMLTSVSRDKIHYCSCKPTWNKCGELKSGKWTQLRASKRKRLVTGGACLSWCDYYGLLKREPWIYDQMIHTATWWWRICWKCLCNICGLHSSTLKILLIPFAHSVCLLHLHLPFNLKSTIHMEKSMWRRQTRTNVF